MVNGGEEFCCEEFVDMKLESHEKLGFFHDN
jgi:hypothetical protein